MSILEFDDSNARRLDEKAENEGVPFGTPPDLSFFSGSLTAPVKGLLRGVIAKPAKLVDDAVTPIIRPLARAADEALGTNAVSNYFERESKKTSQMLNDLKADPITTGVAGRVLHGLFDIGSSAIIYTPEGAAIMEGYATRQELIDNGVTPGAATAAGAVAGATFFAGIKAPMTIGAAAAGRGAQGVAANMLVGAGVNVAAGVANRGFTHELLERAGYKDLAAQYRAFDEQSLWTEAVLGTVLSGGIGAIEARSAAKQAALDAALTVNNSLHAARDTAPGAPVDAKSAAAHHSSLEAAVDQLMRGERVNVAEAIMDAAFLRPTPAGAEAPISAAIREAYRDDLPAAASHAPSDRLAAIPVEQRRALPFNAPELNEYAASVEQKYGLPGGLINALKNAGEKSGSAAVSPKGARGVMQFMPENLRKYGVTDVSDPAQIIDAAGQYLRDTSKQYDGNVDAMIADYNGGPRQARRVMNGEAPAAAETQAYLARVRDYLGRDKQTPRKTAVPLPDDYAASVQRVAEIDPARAEPTFRDGTAYTRESILPFYDRLMAEREAGAAVPDVLFQVGRVDDQVTAGLRQYLPEFDGSTRDAAIGSDAIRLIAETQPAIAREVLAKIDDAVLYADEVLPNPADPSRAILVMRDGRGDGEGVVLEVAMTDKGIQVVAPSVGHASSLEGARALKREMDVARPQHRAGVDREAAGADSGAELANPIPRTVLEAPDAAPAAPRAPGADSTAFPRSGAPAASDRAAEPGRARTDADAAGDMPEVRSARAIASELGDMRIAMEDGTEMTASEALALADDAMLQAANDARAFEAAITCFLRNGS